MLEWLERAGVQRVDGPEPEAVIVFDPSVGPPTGEGPRLAVLPLLPDDWVARDDVEEHVVVRADAYAGDEPGFLDALQYLAGPRPDPHEGPLRLTFLGGLGTWRAKPEVGHAVLLDGRCTIGRAPSCDLEIRTGAHSDQNVTARLHALVEPVEGGIAVTDLRSTRGTWVDGRRIEETTTATAGSELAVAGCLRVRVDGRR